MTVINVCIDVSNIKLTIVSFPNSRATTFSTNYSLTGALSLWLVSGPADQALEWTILDAATRPSIRASYAAADISPIVSAFGSADAPTSSEGISKYTTCTGLLDASLSTWPSIALFQIAASGASLNKPAIDAGVMIWEYPEATVSLNQNHSLGRVPRVVQAMAPTPKRDDAWSCFGPLLTVPTGTPTAPVGFLQGSNNQHEFNSPKIKPPPLPADLPNLLDIYRAWLFCRRVEDMPAIAAGDTDSASSDDVANGYLYQDVPTDVLHLSLQINQCFGEFDQRLDGINRRLNDVSQQFDGINQTLNDVNQQFDGISQKFNEVNQEFDGISQKFNKVNQEFDDINQRFNEVNKELDDIKQRSKEVNQEFDDINQRLHLLDEQANLMVKTHIDMVEELYQVASSALSH
ncbi:hypothetical protein EDC04DRAFT_2601793 [Pisolithus marmoratus]|nr:hypothetical protein EDC04DRAFT_2601793 [Pisolithus marmoratus]